MEEIKEKKSIVTSYRLTQDTKDKLKEQLDQMGLTQEEYFKKIVSVMELENVKQNNIFAINSTELQELTQRINNLFVGLCDQGNSFLSNKDIELEELKAKYKDMLLNKDNSITQLKEDLQQVYNNLTVVQNENDNNKNELDSIKFEYMKQFEQLESNLNDKTSLIEEYKGKNDMLLTDLKEYKIYKTQVEELKASLEQYKTDNNTKDNSIKDLNKEIKIKDDSINNLNLKNAEQLKELTNKHKLDLEQSQKENKLNIKLAVAEIKEELNNKLSQEQQKYNKEIEEYQNKYKLLLEELENSRKTVKKNKAAVTVNK